MDKQEYKIRNDEIKLLIKQREFQKAVEIADTIDWTKVRSVTTLCTISDLYKVNRRYEEAKLLMEQAYEKYPNGRMIVYSLCELCIRMGEIVMAIEYYKQYVSQWPTDKGKFILQYKIYETQDVSLEERIAVLEELKKRDYEERWGYELANLYHRMGLSTKCVEECDELIIWFREGPYVKKAMELKMLHQQLTDSQLSLYESMLPPGQRAQFVSQMAEEMKEQKKDDEIMVKTMDMGQYNTINLQKALAESMKDVLVPEGATPEMMDSYIPKSNLTQELQVQEVVEQLAKPENRFENYPVNENNQPNIPSEPMIGNMNDTGEMEELFFDDGNRSTEEMKLSALESLKSLQTPGHEEQEQVQEEVPRSIDNDEKFERVDTDQIPQYDPVRELELTMVYDPSMLPEELQNESTNNVEEELQPVEEETIIAATKRIDSTAVAQAVVSEVEATRVFTKEDLETIAANTANTEPVSRKFPSEDIGDRDKDELMRIIDEKVQQALENALNSEKILARTQAQMAMRQPEPPSEMKGMLSQEYDGQIGMVLPTSDPVEKQITGQLNINDLLGEWENTKIQNHNKIEAETNQKILERTGNLFTEFEAKARDSILEQLEKEAALEKEEEVEESVVEEITTEEENISVSNEEPINEKVEEISEEPVSDAKDDTSEEEITEEEPVESEESSETEEVEELEEIEETSDDEIKEDPEELPEEEVEEEIDEESDDEASDDEASDNDDYDDDEDDTDDSEDEENEKGSDVNRAMTEDELSLFGQFAQTKRARQKFLRALDKVSLAAYTGNICVTGDTPEESLELAKNVIRYIQGSDRNFSGKIAKVTGVSLNNKSVSVMVEKLANGGLIIERASGMNAETTKDLLKALNQEKTGIVVVLQDGKKQLHKMLEYFDGMKSIFNVHIEVEELSDDALVAYGKKYAEHLEYSIDDMGVLALHTRIDALQTSDHVVTVSDVRDIVDEAIANANKKTFKHFTDVLLSKRYDDEDMIILREKDFIE